MTATPATPAAPATPPVTPAAPATQPGSETSLLPDAPAAPAAPATPPAQPAAPAPATEWFYADGVKGNGNAPDWFKSTKYKTVDEQAKAYVNLEKRLGAFTGAPEGDYEIKVPDQYKDVVQVDTTHPVFGNLSKWARDKQLSQEGFNDLIGMLSEYEASVFEPPPTVEDAKKTIGANADARLQSISAFANANFDDATKAALRAALSPSNPKIAETVALIESMIAKTRQPAVPSGGTPPPAESELEAINRMQAEIDPATKKRRYEVDAVFRNEVEKRRRDWFAKQKQSAATL